MRRAEAGRGQKTSGAFGSVLGGGWWPRGSCEKCCGDRDGKVPSGVDSHGVLRNEEQESEAFAPAAPRFFPSGRGVVVTGFC